MANCGRLRVPRFHFVHDPVFSISEVFLICPNASNYGYAFLCQFLPQFWIGRIHGNKRVLGIGSIMPLSKYVDGVRRPPANRFVEVGHIITGDNKVFSCRLVDLVSHYATLGCNRSVNRTVTIPVILCKLILIVLYDGFRLLRILHEKLGRNKVFGSAYIFRPVQPVNVDPMTVL